VYFFLVGDGAVQSVGKVDGIGGEGPEGECVGRLFVSYEKGVLVEVVDGDSAEY